MMYLNISMVPKPKPINRSIGLPISYIQCVGGDHMHCGCEETYGRSFLTKEEKMDRLKEYKEWLEKEAQGVQETIQKLKSAG